MIRVGIIGAGFIGELHARAVHRTPGAELVAACRNDEKALAEFCSAHRCLPFSDYHKLIASDAIDAVVIATPHHLHSGIAVDAARAGKAILLEKPMAPSMQECDEILAAVGRHRVPFMVGFVNHFAKAYKSAKAVLSSGEMGEAVMGSSTMAKVWMEPNRRSWHLDRRSGGGMWLTAGIHCLDRLTWLFGSKIKRVSASFGTRFHRQNSDDSGLVFVRFENGAVGSVTSVGYRTGAPNHLTDLYCSEGALRIDYSRGVEIGREEKWTTLPDSGSEHWLPEAIDAEWGAFIGALTSGSEMPVSGEYGRHVMAAAFAAEESARTGRETDVI